MTETPHTTTKYYYLPLGYDCSPATALKSLGLRTCSLPFDWVQSNHQIVMHCIKDDFKNFHRHLYLIKGQTKNGQRLIDHYGVEFPHDYPCSYGDPSLNTPEAVADDAAFFPETTIIDTYKKYGPIVLQKYQKRIHRFYEMLNDTSRPIIILMRELFHDVMLIKDYLENKFNRKNIMFVVATDETHLVDLPPLMTYFNPYIDRNSGDEEKDLHKWKEGINIVKLKYEKMMKPMEIDTNRHHIEKDKHGHWFL